MNQVQLIIFIFQLLFKEEDRAGTIEIIDDMIIIRKVKK